MYRRSKTSLIRSLILVCGLAGSIDASTAPLSFTSSEYQTSGTALVSTLADAQFASSLSTPLPLVSTAVAFGATDFASGSGVAAEGLLAAQSEASSIGGFASGAGSSSLAARYVANTRYTGLHFVFSALDFTDPAAFSSSTLFVTLTSGASTFLSQLISASGTYDFLVSIPFGALVDLNVSLSSEADVFRGGNASNNASLAFSIQAVPEPSTILLTLLALFALWLVRHRTGRGPAPRLAA